MLGRRESRLRFKRCNIARKTGCQTDLRLAKIQNFGVPTLGHEEVRGLDVAMDNASAWAASCPFGEGA